jgi:hypothetical protein
LRETRTTPNHRHDHTGQPPHRGESHAERYEQGKRLTMSPLPPHCAGDCLLGVTT